MLLFEGEPLLFGLFSVAVLCLLIGGCTWGSREDASDQTGMIIGIVIFTVGLLSTVLFIMAYSYKKIRQRKLARLEQDKLHSMLKQFQAEDSSNTIEVTRNMSRPGSQGFYNKAVTPDTPEIEPRRGVSPQPNGHVTVNRNF